MNKAKKSAIRSAIALIGWLALTFSFGLQRPDLAFAEIIILLVAIIATLVLFWRVRRPAALLLIPYALWAAFATVLNFTIWRLNV